MSGDIEVCVVQSQSKPPFYFAHTCLTVQFEEGVKCWSDKREELGAEQGPASVRLGGKDGGGGEKGLRETPEHHPAAH